MWQKIELYIISLVFLFIIILANQIPVCIGSNCHFIPINELLLHWPPVISFCMLGIVLAIIFYFKFRYRVVKGGTLPGETIEEIENLNFENLTFLATYIIPLVAFDLDFHLRENRNFMILILVLILIGWIYIKTNIFYTNPTLSILNFRIYKIKTNKRQNAIVISMAKLNIDDMILLNKMDEKIFYASKYGTKQSTKTN
jgi:hypothetical protein